MKAQERALLEKLYQTMAHLNSPMTVVFDGREKDPPEATLRNLLAMNIVFTPKRQTADEYILEMLDYSKNVDQEMVVSSDMELLRRSKQKGARTKTIKEFIELVSKKSSAKAEERKQSKETKADFERLLKIFEKNQDSPSSN